MREKASSMCRLRTTNISDERHKLVHGGRWAFCQPRPKCTCGGPLCSVHFEDPAERAMATGCPLLGKMLDSTALKSPTSQDFLQKMHKTTLFVADFSSEQSKEEWICFQQVASRKNNAFHRAYHLYKYFCSCIRSVSPAGQ